MKSRRRRPRARRYHFQRRPGAGVAVMGHRCAEGGASGFSLIELMTALVVFALLLAIGPPAYRDWIAAQQLANHARFIVNTLELARSEAIKHGYRVNVCKTRDGRQCADDGGWETGWLGFVDQDRDGQPGSAEFILRREGPAGKNIT